MKLLLKFNLVFLLVFADRPRPCPAWSHATCCSVTPRPRCSTAPGC